MSLSNQEYQILFEIFNTKKGLNSNLLKRRLNLTEDNFNNFITNLVSNEYCEKSKNNLSITNNGITQLTDSAFKVPVKRETKRKFKKEKHEGNRIGINEFYIPLNFEK